MRAHTFGGAWTQDKLNRIRKYLSAYTILFHGNAHARYYSTIYVDAFAGTGHRTEQRKATQDIPLFPTDPEAEEFRKGSARIALEIKPPFKRYYFIERHPKRVQELNGLRSSFPDLEDRVEVISDDANVFLTSWCSAVDWSRNRAVVFLDPYGMQVEWITIEAIARTHGIDLWYLFPYIAVSRMSTRDAPPPEDWSQLLTRIFGTDSWRDAFYPRSEILTLFGNEESHRKDADLKKVTDFFIGRLQDVFPGVASNPLILRNSTNTPLYILCFATSNPEQRIIKTALNIAQDILRT
ncbi:MAG TPA: three-Cys-motif partner protein TcmP [Candidatus Kapabacteria bacterium]|nr:three-Cys-motif partner protein TcmP [Candidatus Kapabacteria bacterium]